EQFDVAGGVAAAPAGRAVRGHQPQTVVLTQGLRVQTGELGRHRDDVDRSVLGQFIRVASTAVHLYQAPFAAWNRSARGSSSAVASRYASSASRAFPDRSPGTLTSTVTSRSPRVPSLRTAPLPRARMVRPLGVPGGSFSVTGGPPRVGTRTSPPSAASAKVTGTVTVRLSPLRPNTGWVPTCTTTYRSPAGPPRSPGAPLPRSRMRCPSLTPAGMRTCMVREDLARPLPLQTSQACSAISPRPLQSGHGSVSEKPPPEPRATCPVPTQVGHTRGVPFLSPVPEQVLHGAWEDIRRGTVAPSMASVKPRVTSVSTSCPRRGWVRAPAPRLNSPPNPSPRPPPKPPGPGAPPNRSPRSKLNEPPAPGPGRNPPLPNSARASSYSLRFFGSPRTSAASEISLKRSSALALPLLASGWNSRASFRYAFLISASVASLGTPRTL